MILRTLIEVKHVMYVQQWQFCVLYNNLTLLLLRRKVVALFTILSLKNSCVCGDSGSSDDVTARQQEQRN